MNIKTIYLLGPMTGYPQFNHPAFNNWAAKLRKDGFTVVNPAEIDASLGEPETYEGYYARDLPFLAKCDAGAAMPGWRASKGATAEAFLLGTLLKRPVFILPDMTILSDHLLPRLVVP